MTAYTDFHYSPTGSGVISGAQVLEQTEQGINGLGQYVQDNVSGAIDTANEALTTARNADSNATTAINLANGLNAQIIAANQTAGNALTTAQSAQNTANAASSLATTANNSATTALNAANSASAGVTALTGTVNSLGNRMTAAENNISTNAGNITTLQNSLATTNANVTAAANAASSAQATATSAQSTATLARNQAYVLRYTGTTITGGGTIAYADIDNTDNIKAGDKIIDISGAIYDIASVDTANQTVTVGASPVINLFCDAENLIPAANEAYDLGSSSYQWNNVYSKNYFYNGTAWGLDKNNTWTGNNTFNTGPVIYGYSNIRNSNMEQGTIPQSVLYNGVFFSDKNNNLIGSFDYSYGTSGNAQVDIRLSRNNANAARELMFSIVLPQSGNGELNFNGNVKPKTNNTFDLGTSTNKWKSFNGINPGALSLPDTLGTSGTENVNYFNVIGYLNNTGTIATIPSTATYDGWLYINAKDGADSYIIIDDSPASFGTSVFGNNGLGSQSIGLFCLICPIRKGHTYNVRIKSAGIVSARIYPAQGNV